jgi:REP element-mobilizing transposase RayT
MPRNRKLFIHGTMVDLCFRTEEGLPFTAGPIIKAIFLSILARAQSLYGFTLCHFVIMANHPHILGVIEDPLHVPRIIQYIKRESAHAINRLFGREKHTVWGDGYDSPIILDAAKAIERIVHAYLNPQQANLEKTIEAYPHITSWQAFLDGGEELHLRGIPRNAVTKLPKRTISLKEQEEYVNRLLEHGSEECTLFIDPDAWMGCFDELAEREPAEINQLIINRVRQDEQRLNQSRKGNVMGAHALKLERIDKKHTPKKHGRRMLCFSSLKPLSVAFIRFHREQCAKAPKLGQGFTVKDWLTKLPPGLFAPGCALAANIVPSIVPTANTFTIHP